LLDKLYKKIQGDDLFDLTEDPKEVIVEGMLYRKDYIMIVAPEKEGKTILSQQLASSLSSGVPFLGILDIPKPMNVWYFATEGRAGDLKDRFIRINNKVKINKDNITLIPSFFKFNTDEGVRCLEEIINEEGPENYPDVLFIDSLYSGFKGTLKDDESINKFNHVVRMLIEKLNCSVILVHHMRKQQKNQEGANIKRNDKDAYGSAFLAAAVDHIFWIEKWQRDEDAPNDKMLRCDTQRGGDIIDKLRIRLMAPDPLYFQVVDKYIESKNMVVKKLHTSADGFCMDHLIKTTKMSRSKLFVILKELQNDKMVEKYNFSGGKIVYYRLSGYP